MAALAVCCNAMLPLAAADVLARARYLADVVLDLRDGRGERV